ncbi:RNase P subunit p30 [Nemania sp. FL0916]|nr:RNase P subunit p30 [Nemania sp. FL0916]
MLYDLNIVWSPHASAAELERTLRFSASLGYTVVALNHTIGAPIPPLLTNPIPKFDSPAPTSSSTSSAPPPKMPTVLRRATLVLSENKQHHRIPQLAAEYDIVAVRPVTEESFAAACNSLDHVSLISLDLTARQPFRFRPRPCMWAVDRGLRFEVCYAQALQGPAPTHVLASKGTKESYGGGGAGGPDARARATFIGNLAALVRATRGRGIVISSEAQSVLGLRAPADVVNLFNVWGMSTDRAKEGLGMIPRSVVVNEGIKRNGFRGVVEIVNLAEGERPDVEMGEAGQDSTATPAGNTQGGKDKKNKNQETNNSGGKKRKNGDNSGASTTPANPDGNGEGQPISKRQAKRDRVALREQQAKEKAAAGS